MAKRQIFTKQKLYDLLARAVSTANKVDYAIGGAEAMAANGYVRNTNDIDVFITEKSLNRFAAGLRKAGLTFHAINEPSHYIAKLPGDPDFERRIDVLVPFGDPELSAIEDATTIAYAGHELRFFKPNLLAVVKFGATEFTEDPKHTNDLLAMYRRGIFDPDLVREMVVFMDQNDGDRFDAMIASFQTKKTDKNPHQSKSSKRLPRRFFQ